MIGLASTDTLRAAHRALLADGSAVWLRALGPEDRAAVDALHRGLSVGDRYLRFFTASTFGAEHIAGLIVGPGSVAVGAFADDRLLGVAHYRIEPEGVDPELAVVVDHRDHHHGVATLMLEEIVALARAAGVRRFTAEVLAENHDMIRVLRDSGLPYSVVPDGSVQHIVVHLPPVNGSSERADDYVDAMLERAALADLAALRPALTPRSVVVIGAGRRPDSVGRLLLHQIMEGGFTGPVYVVNPHADAVDGVPCHRSVEDLPADVDLAVVCVPADAVPDTAERCGRHGVRALLVITSGVSTNPALAAGLADAVDRHGMRVIGPNCIGTINTDPAVRLQATFGRAATPGVVGLAAQSGGVAIALTTVLDRLGIGISTAVSTGDSFDVNGDDMLVWWADDPRTTAAVLYVESLRRPHLFARLARRLARRKPVLTIRSGSSEVGRRAAASHSAGTATPRVVRDALFAQAGVIAVDEISDLTGALALMCWQPLPAGPRVAVVSNAGGAGVLAADACAHVGLTVGPLTTATHDTLTALLPATAAVANPVDVTATIPSSTYAAVLEALLIDPGIDAVLAISVSTEAGDPLVGIGPVADHRPAKPLVAVRLGQDVGVQRLDSEPGGDAVVPTFADPAAAARALAAAAGRAAWLRRTDQPAGSPDGVDRDRALAAVATGQAELDPRDGGWLGPESASRLAAAAGLPMVATDVVHDAKAALEVWRGHGEPVALKADVPGVTHKSRVGGVRTGLDTAHQISATVHDFQRRFGPDLRGIVVQPMVPAGVELLVGVTADPLCGPLLTLGIGGTSTDLIDDRSHCLVPATDADLDDLVDGMHAAPLLFRGDECAARRQAVRDVAARLAWLADQLPEVAEAEINPLVLETDAPVAVDLRIRLAPSAPSDPWLRNLPM